MLFIFQKINVINLKFRKILVNCVKIRKCLQKNIDRDKYKLQTVPEDSSVDWVHSILDSLALTHCKSGFANRGWWGSTPTWKASAKWTKSRLFSVKFTSILFRMIWMIEKWNFFRCRVIRWPARPQSYPLDPPGGRSICDNCCKSTFRIRPSNTPLDSETKCTPWTSTGKSQRF